MLFAYLTSHSDSHKDEYESQGGKVPEGWVAVENGGPRLPT